MIIKHKKVSTETVKDNNGKESEKITETITDLSQLIIDTITWEGSRMQVARKLEFSYSQDARDPNLPNYVIEPGETVYSYDEGGTLQFNGRGYTIEKKTASSTITVTCFDDLFLLCKSKVTRKYTNAKAEDIVKSVCAEMGVTVGNIVETGKTISFIASEKTGYQIIMIAYTEAAKQINATKKNADEPDVLFHPVMNGDKLDIVKKGELIPNYEANQYVNIEDSEYRESIENMVNKIIVADDQGNTKSTQQKDDLIKKYGVTIQDVYKESKKATTNDELEKIFHKPDRSGIIECIGDYRCKSSYSIAINDLLAEITGKFWIKSDTHTFENGLHFMRLEIEFENVMNKEKLPEDKQGGAKGWTVGSVGNANSGIQEGINNGYAAWQGTTMPNGRNGCVEAATRIGSWYSPYLKEQYENGTTSVSALIANAGSDNVVSFSDSNLEIGDCVVFDGDEHTVIYAGNGMYVGNNSSANGGIGGVGQGSIYGLGMTPTAIIKTSHI
ncbi:XkdQ/YqbQ family protein [Megasphaera vaginalis (ex Srinivasan et al. 2021)]|uniref:YqbQ/XkdQ domain-containing protein n=1 Tax=Megasphaera vaginalis (ex Srinivasan et al. 2021) TaxID=1111454 RepID=U7ULH4_9FIRM|nr:hypothetical protein [Megasphaera vaginalis (ex Srinivasan et al. 2021)]ERT59353.1 hypothetical protein HMPREF1250_0196 [Megasphaera vaginalis (ex Srinivasan et al. 2021)]